MGGADMPCIKSGFLEMVSHGDCILAYLGFLIEEELAAVEQF